MPNWVYSGISISTPLTKKQEKILKEIEKSKSICDYYIPRPNEMDNTQCPPTIISKKEFEKQEKENKKKLKEHKEGEHLWLDKGITQKMSDNLIKKFGSNNWYDWSCTNWGTKWGDCSLEINDETFPFVLDKGGRNFKSLRFETAWSPIADNILEMFMRDFPSFHYHYEEEQGWGGELDVEDGKVIDECEYDVPIWSEDIEYKGEYLVKLKEEHPNYESGVGYYLDYGYEYIGKTLEEAKEYIDSFDSVDVELTKN
tara:strand:+ start:5954 stop:6721 length:768 start_codon:yes stop_codon:yes gene_type:complete